MTRRTDTQRRRVAVAGLLPTHYYALTQLEEVHFIDADAEFPGTLPAFVAEAVPDVLFIGAQTAIDKAFCQVITDVRCIEPGTRFVVLAQSLTPEEEFAVIRAGALTRAHPNEDLVQILYEALVDYASVSGPVARLIAPYVLTSSDFTPVKKGIISDLAADRDSDIPLWSLQRHLANILMALIEEQSAAYYAAISAKVEQELMAMNPPFNAAQVWG